MSRITHIFRHLSYAAKNGRSNPAWGVYRKATRLEEEAMRSEFKERLAELEGQLVKLKRTHKDELRIIQIHEKILQLRRMLLKRPAP